MKTQPPQLILPERPEWRALYEAAWAGAARGVREPLSQTPDGEAFLCDPAATAMRPWDACFAALWARHAPRAVAGLENPLSDLENFYAAQREDGSIPGDLLAPGGAADPPLFSWAEWEYYLTTGDDARLPLVLPFLRAHFQWHLRARRRKEGALFCAAEETATAEIPRGEAHGWIDRTSQMALDCECLANIALHCGDAETGRAAAATFLEIKELVNATMWDEFRLVYTDIDEDGLWTGPVHLGAYWTLLSGLATEERATQMTRHLRSWRSFARRNRVPLLAAFEKGFREGGGAIRPEVVYTLVRGLERNGQEDLAQEIAANLLDLIAAVYTETGAIWSAYAPDDPTPHNTARHVFAGPALVAPISMMVETGLGIRVDAPNQEVLWHLRLAEPHGIRGLRVGAVHVDLHAEPLPDARFRVQHESDGPLCLLLATLAGTRIVEIPRAGRGELIV